MATSRPFIVSLGASSGSLAPASGAANAIGQLKRLSMPYWSFSEFLTYGYKEIEISNEAQEDREPTGSDTDVNAILLTTLPLESRVSI